MEIWRSVYSHRTKIRIDAGDGRVVLNWEYMNSRVCLISLRFSPAWLSLLPAWGRVFEALGFEVDYVIHPKFKSFAEFANKDSTILSTDKGWSARSGYSHALFVGPDAGNHVYGKELKRTGCKIWYIYHEPWESLRAYLQTESFRVAIKLIAAHYLSVKMLKTSDGVILPSQRCVTNYVRSDVRHNPRYFKVPLLFDDEASDHLNEQRIYFSYIGAITKAHGFEGFLQFVKYALQRNLDIRFLIASRIALPEEVAKDPIIAGAPDRVVIRCGRPLTNDEINLCYAQSICVWNVYLRSTQSGVLAKAMMFGAPVLAAETGSFPEYVTDHQEGRLLKDANPERVYQAYEEIRRDLNRYTASSRKRFLETFYYTSQLDLCRRIFLAETDRRSGA
jgi:glycosyltransferase involved in cell wall biosynthesis